jgi:hypothetical protein
LLDDIDALAVHDRRPAEVRPERVGVRDVVRVDGSCEADRDDQQEECERCERDPVAAQAARGEAPRALAGDLP